MMRSLRGSGRSACSALPLDGDRYLGAMNAHHLRSFAFLPAAVLAVATACGQVQVNPQAGGTFQNLTDTPEGYEYKANVGFQLGVDLRYGGAFYVQPGVFLGRNATTLSVPVVTVDPNDPNNSTGEVTTVIEDDLIRTILKLRAMVGYKLINEERAKLRIAIGPSYDVLMSVDSKDDRIAWNKSGFKAGTYNLEAGLGLDLAFITLEPGVAFGLSKVFEEDPNASAIGSKYFVLYFNVGIVIGKGM